MTLEKRIEQLEKEMAELKRQVQPNINEVDRPILKGLIDTYRSSGKIVAETITGVLAHSATENSKISFNDENIFISDDMKEVSYEVARKVHHDISKVLCDHNLTIRQAARALDLAKTGIIDRRLMPKISQ